MIVQSIISSAIAKELLYVLGVAFEILLPGENMKLFFFISVSLKPFSKSYFFNKNDFLKNRNNTFNF